jgi:hypothetical protein
MDCPRAPVRVPGVRSVLSKPRESGGMRGVEKEVSSIYDNLQSEWVELPSRRWTGDGPTLVSKSDNLERGTSQGCKVERAEARSATSMGQGAKGRNTNACLNRRVVF